MINTQCSYNIVHYKFAGSFADRLWYYIKTKEWRLSQSD